MRRDRYTDFLRALAISLVVLGHWLITALVAEPDGTIAAPELLAAVPWTRWLTLGFQIMPVFFLAGGHSAVGSWTRTRARGGGAAGWVRRRAVRLLLPTAVYCALVLLALAVGAAAGADPGVLALVGWAMAMQFWFLPVYLLLGALTPALYTAHLRWGLRAPVALGATAVAVDVLVVAAHTPYVGLLNHLLVWGVAYQLGFCWRDGLLARRRTATALAAGGAAAFALLTGPGPFPVSLILVSTDGVSNTNPPSAAMLAWAVAQTGGCLLAARPARRWLRHERVWRAVRPVGGAGMTLYLWHMLPVPVAAAAFYLTGLAPAPALDSAAWWALRAPWLLTLSVLLLAVLLALRPLERALAAFHPRLDPDAEPGRPALFWLGLGGATAALTRWATEGFAHDGRFPVLPVLGFALGTALVLTPFGSRAPAPHPDMPDRARV